MINVECHSWGIVPQNIQSLIMNHFNILQSLIHCARLHRVGPGGPMAW
jgi:hypothetical protein